MGLEGGREMRVDPGVRKYEYSTACKQKFVYRFIPNAPREFVRDLDWEVEVRAGCMPGKYTVVIDRPLIKRAIFKIDVCLQIKQDDELSCETIKVPGWCYADD